MDIFCLCWHGWPTEILERVIWWRIHRALLMHGDATLMQIENGSRAHELIQRSMGGVRDG